MEMKQKNNTTKNICEMLLEETVQFPIFKCLYLKRRKVPNNSHNMDGSQDNYAKLQKTEKKKKGYTLYESIFIKFLRLQTTQQ